MTTKRTTSNALAIIDREFGKDPEYYEMLAEERVMAQAARALYEARAAAGMTQLQLAVLVGTEQSVIERLEDGDYQGHSLAMMQRIADALDQRIELRFVPIAR